MSFKNYINSIGNIDMIDMSEKQKEGALNAWLIDPEKRQLTLKAIENYLLEDHHIASALLLPSADCGRSLKLSFYAALESDMQDCIDGLN